MIPSDNQVHALWDKYRLPDKKRLHVTLVSKVALFFAHKLKQKDPHAVINEPLLRASALLHDIDKNAPKLRGEQHPDACVRILEEEGMDEVARLVRTHPLHAIINPEISPKTTEERLLFLADKMVKYEIITVDKRFDLWRSEPLAPEVRAMIEACYPKVKELEYDIFQKLGVKPSSIAQVAQTE